MARVDGHPGGVLGDPADGLDVVEIELGVYALGEQVERHGDEVEVPGPLAVAEQRSLDPLGPGKKGELGSCHGRAPVVVRVNGQDDRTSRRGTGG